MVRCEATDPPAGRGQPAYRGVMRGAVVDRVPCPGVWGLCVLRQMVFGDGTGLYETKEKLSLAAAARRLARGILSVSGFGFAALSGGHSARAEIPRYQRERQ